MFWKRYVERDNFNIIHLFLHICGDSDRRFSLSRLRWNLWFWYAQLVFCMFYLHQRVSFILYYLQMFILFNILFCSLICNQFFERYFLLHPWRGRGFCHRWRVCYCYYAHHNKDPQTIDPFILENQRFAQAMSLLWCKAQSVIWLVQCEVGWEKRREPEREVRESLEKEIFDVS